MMNLRVNAAAAAALMVSTLLAGCAAYSPRTVRPGMGAPDVVAAMGAPNARHAP